MTQECNNQGSQSRTKRGHGLKLETAIIRVHVTLQIMIKQRFLHFLIIIWANLLFHSYSTISKMIKNLMSLQTNQNLLLYYTFSECTQAGIHKLACSRTLPFWWDDVSDVCTLEALVVQAYNQVMIYQLYKFH